MTICAIICEYNPFHNGHAHHIEETRRITNCDYIISIMSGNYVQRGEPAIMDKWERTRAALKCGSDLVIELPFIYACSSAEYFANAAVDIINKTNVVDFLSFGSDSGDIDFLKNITIKRMNKNIDLTGEISRAYKEGISYPKAMQLIYDEPEMKSNDILGIRYLMALEKSKSSVEPVTIKRKGSEYKDKTITSETPSATAIRKHITDSKDFNLLSKVMPKESLHVLMEEIEKGRAPVTLKSFEKQILSTIRTLKPKGIADKPHITSGLEYRLYQNAMEFSNIDEVIDATISKVFTRTRIQRLLIHALLGVTKEMHASYMDVPYVRVLGFKKRAEPLLKKINRSRKVPVIYRAKKDYENLTDRGKALFELEALSTDIYVLGYPNSMYSGGGQEFSRKIIIVE